MTEATQKRPPYKCAPYPDDETRCVRYNYNPVTGRYDEPRYGMDVACSTCEYWMTEEEIQELLDKDLMRRSPVDR